MRLTIGLMVIALAATIFSTTSFIPASYNNKTDTIPDNLFTVGVGAGLIGGLYDGNYSYKLLKQHGTFGLGAPDKLDGELVVFEGKVYQTQHTGKTFQVDDRQLTPFCDGEFFSARQEDQNWKCNKQRGAFSFA